MNIKFYIIVIYWGLGIGDWGLGIGDWAQSPIPNPHFYFPFNKLIKKISKKINKKYNIILII